MVELVFLLPLLIFLLIIWGNGCEKPKRKGNIQRVLDDNLAYTLGYQDGMKNVELKGEITKHE